jgi:hypothetical protein
MQFDKESITQLERESFIYENLKHKVYKFIMIRNFDENDYFDLGAFFRKYNVRKQADTDKYVVRIIQDIRSSGWNCGTSFYKTGLFIFGNNRPPNFFPDTDEF